VDFMNILVGFERGINNISYYFKYKIVILDTSDFRDVI
jgi:hypothetical protein